MLSSKNLLDKSEYLPGKDLGYKSNVFEKAKFEYSPLSMSLNKAFKKMGLKVLLKVFNYVLNVLLKVFNYDSNQTFYRF